MSWFWLSITAVLAVCTFGAGITVGLRFGTDLTRWDGMRDRALRDNAADAKPHELTNSGVLSR
jgi:hypothetical protein